MGLDGVYRKLLYKLKCDIYTRTTFGLFIVFVLWMRHNSYDNYKLCIF